MIQVLNQIEALYFARQGYLPWARPYERKTYIAQPDECYRGGIRAGAVGGLQG
ncbi:hypothetical protein [Agrobacterium rubi]|uniref:hypothetical protein n=1 Tax=Agrobacterium rubi TaxID=28099 RepID=UPI000A7A1AC0|nr:hypothetical protein [Agrobacterium rubi]MBP1881621.1 hypothetical protein [Agrobacterium rubi]